MRLLHVTDLHFGLPASSVGLKWKTLGAATRQVMKHRVATVMATHDEAATAALGVFVDLERAELDGLLVTGDIGTTGSSENQSLARQELARIAESTPCFVLPGNHDRFGPWWSYAPTSREFEQLVAPHFVSLAPPFGVAATEVEDGVIVLGIDASLDSLAGLPGHGRRLAHGVIRDVALAAVRDLLDAHEDASHLVVAIHFPVMIDGAIPADHVAFDASRLLGLLLANASKRAIPTLVVSGHLHRESYVMHAGLPLWHYTGGSVSKQYPLRRGRNSCALIETTADGFAIQRYDFDPTPGIEAFVPDSGGPRWPIVIY